MNSEPLTPSLEPVVIPPENKKSAWKSILRETFQTILMALVLYLVIDAVVARVRVENVSMKPTLHAGEFLLVDKISTWTGSFKRGDIVVFHYPPHPEEDYIKRVIGLSGDEIIIKDGKVTVNGELLEEAYIAASPTYNGTWKVPADNFFVLGDNRNQSSDSHSWGYVPKNNIVGKALVIYWPLDQLKILNETPVVKAKN